MRGKGRTGAGASEERPGTDASEGPARVIYIYADDCPRPRFPRPPFLGPPAGARGRA